MAYNVYLDKCLLPITPEKITLKVKNGNKTLTLMNEGEVNVLKNAKLSEVEFTCELPNVRGYPFAVYKGGYLAANYFLSEFERLKNSKKPFQFIVVREKPDGKRFYSTNLKVSLEDYSIEESAKNGFDVKVKIKLKQYREYGTKTVKIARSSGSSSGTASPRRAASTTQTKSVGIGSEVIVNGRLFGSSYGNAPGMTLTNYRGKINFINLKGSHPYHVTTPNGGWLGWVLKESVKVV